MAPMAAAMILPTEQPIRFRRANARGGFTLVELLLVLVLLGVIVGISMPYFVHSIRGNRLRVAGRTLVTVSRYARSMAVLKQAEVALTFDLDSGKIDVVSSNAELPRFTRNLEGVLLESVAVADAEPADAGVCAVPYYRNGMCRPFVVRMVDQHGAGLTVKVDALAAVRVTPD